MDQGARKQEWCEMKEGFGVHYCNVLPLQKRTELQKLDPSVTEPNITPLIDGNSTLKTRKQLSQLLDTTLLKCYLEVE